MGVVVCSEGGLMSEFMDMTSGVAEGMFAVVVLSVMDIVDCEFLKQFNVLVRMALLTLVHVKELGIVTVLGSVMRSMEPESCTMENMT
jgi:hypothetical protein